MRIINFLLQQKLSYGLKRYYNYKVLLLKKWIWYLPYRVWSPETHMIPRSPPGVIPKHRTSRKSWSPPGVVQTPYLKKIFHYTFLSMCILSFPRTSLPHPLIHKSSFFPKLKGYLQNHRNSPRCTTLNCFFSKFSDTVWTIQITREVFRETFSPILCKSSKKWNNLLFHNIAPKILELDSNNPYKPYLSL